MEPTSDDGTGTAQADMGATQPEVTKEPKDGGEDGLDFSRVHSFVLWFILSVTFGLCFVRRYTIPTWSDVLAKDFQMDATEFGTLSGGYWYAYSALQIPFGLLLDMTNRQVFTSHIFLLCFL